MAFRDSAQHKVMENQLLMCLESCDTTLTFSSKETSVLKDDRVLETLLKSDDQHVPSQTYFDYQTDLREYMRKMVAKWMVEVCDEQGCHEDVVITAIYYLDRFLTQIFPLKRTQLQLLAATCMFIASKFRDCNPISAQHLAMYTDYSITVDQLLEYELAVLQALKWELALPGPYDFLDQILFRITSLSDTKKRLLRRHSSTLIVMCAVEPKFMTCPPSLVSSACLCAAGSGLMGERWCSKVQLHRTIRQITNTEKETLRHYQQQIEALLSENVSGDSSTLSSDSSHQQAGDEEGTPSKSSDNNHQRLPCTPTDVLDIQLIS